MVIKNLNWLRTADPADPQFGIRLHEALNSVVQQCNNYELQGNLNANGQPEPPPNIQGISVTGANGKFNISIVDQSNGLKRGVNYQVEHADNPQFVNPEKINLGDSRSHTVSLGNVTRYWRAYSSYPTGQPSQAVYHGSAAEPAAVTGGGVQGGPLFQPSQGSGTGAPGQGLVGPGPVPVRSDNTGFDWNAQGGVVSTPAGTVK